MHPLLHRLPLVLLPMFRLQPRVRVFLLHARSKGLVRVDVEDRGLHEGFGDGADVGDEVVDHVEGHALADDDAKDLGVLFTGREGVVWSLRLVCKKGRGDMEERVLGMMYCLALRSLETCRRVSRVTCTGTLISTHRLLLDMRMVLLECVAEGEGYDGETWIVCVASLALHILVLGVIFEDPFLAVDITDLDDRQLDSREFKKEVTYTSIPARLFQSSTEQPRIRQCVLHDIPIPIESQMNQIEILRDNLSSRAREIQRERLLRAA